MCDVYSDFALMTISGLKLNNVSTIEEHSVKRMPASRATRYTNTDTFPVVIATVNNSAAAYCIYFTEKSATKNPYKPHPVSIARSLLFRLATTKMKNISRRNDVILGVNLKTVLTHHHSDKGPYSAIRIILRKFDEICP